MGRGPSIEGRKSVEDAKRAKVFTKLIREITVATRAGVADPADNARLRSAVDKALAANMTRDTIDRAIKRGSGADGGAEMHEMRYEGYGPAGVAFIIDCVTDNPVRTVADVRHALTKHGGNLGENGCVSWIFSKKGSIVIDKKLIGEDELMELALEAGAEDVKVEDGEYEVITEPAAFETVKKAIDAKGIKHLEASISMIPSNTVKLDAGKAESMLKLMEKLEDNDDVQAVS